MRCFFRIGLDAHIMALTDLQEKHKLFLDLEEDEVRKKYCETYPKGTHYLDFIYMICKMTKEENIKDNKVVIDQINMMIDKLSCGCTR